MLLELAWRSLVARRGSVLLTLLSMVIGVVLILGVEQAGSQTRASFTRTISGVDLLVGARTSPLHLLLYSVFRIGSPSRNLRWSSYQSLAADPRVAWAAPLALGDSHRGHRVVGTTPEFLEHFRYGDRQPLVLLQGSGFASSQSAVLGADAARRLGYRAGSSFVIAHGLVDTAFSRHAGTPFIVTGVLAATGTPVDQAIYVHLDGLDAAHGIDGHEHEEGHEEHHDDELAHADHDADARQVSAVLLGLQARNLVFQVQRDVESFDDEALTAVLPGVVLAELWQSLRLVERVLGGISAAVLLASLLGLATMLLVSLQQRQRELALYRALGARPWFIVLLLETEALLLTATALVAGFVTALGLQWLLAPLLRQEYGLVLEGLPLNLRVACYAAAALGLAALLALIPAVLACRRTLPAELAGQH